MTIKRPSCLVVLSGGQDSTTCLFWAKAYFDEVHAITFDYGQRHAREIAAAQAVAVLAGCASHEFVHVPRLAGTSPLTDVSQNLETYTDHASMEAIIGSRVEKTFVPMRNALFLTLAANRAVCMGVQHLVTGVCEADNANYPDCRQAFITAQERAIQEALAQPFTIHTPLMYLSKAESIRMALSLGYSAYAALAFSHTAYDGNYPPVGKDHASVLRAHGFGEARVPDPLVVRAALIDKVMPLPLDSHYTAYPNMEALVATINQLQGALS